MVSIELLGGDGEIGGNKILLEHKGTRIFLDFGMSFTQDSRYFSEYLKPRKAGALGDYFETGLLPDIKGIYRKDYLQHMGRPEEDRSIDAVLISHAHADHAQYIHFLRRDIPIYCTKATKIILQCLQDVGKGNNEFINVYDAYTFYTNTKGNLSKVTKSTKGFVQARDYHIMMPSQREVIGSIEVEMVPVDHSLPGACGYIIYTDEGNIVYTGDIRFHGYNGHLSEEFVKRAKQANPKWIICEGTRINDDTKHSEAEVCLNFIDIISKTEGLVFIEHPMRDIDRVTSIFEAARKCNRELVINLKLAYLIEMLDDLCPFSINDVKILLPPKEWGLICKDGVEQNLINQEYYPWEKSFLERENIILTEDIRMNPERYVVSMNLWTINQLIDIKPEGATWIKASCDAYSDEMELDDERKQHWLDHFRIDIHKTHASGHASGDEIRWMLNEIGAEEVIPIHTEDIDAFKSAL